LVLREATFSFLPELKSVEWGELWARPVTDGTALEWAMVAALGATAAKRGWTVELPVLRETDGRMLFPLRNEIPRHHGGQAGHAAAADHTIELGRRIVQAFIPKLIFRSEGRAFCLFREGCPYHLLMGDQDYLDRPDILLVEGEPMPPQPMDGSVCFGFKVPNGILFNGAVRAVNAPAPVLIERMPQGGGRITASGLIECTIGKTASVADSQLTRYKELFGLESNFGVNALIASTREFSCQWPVTVVPLSGGRDEVAVHLTQAAEIAIQWLD
jgi:hypothetical protein